MKSFLKKKASVATPGNFSTLNSHLNEVIDRQKGNPVSLSILYIEVARVAGVRVDGISLRKHFVVAVGSGDERMYIDPFHSGGLMSRKECMVSVLCGEKVSGADLDELERRCSPLSHTVFVAARQRRGPRPPI
jgi:hypothetical protein